MSSCRATRNWTETHFPVNVFDLAYEVGITDSPRMFCSVELLLFFAFRRDFEGHLTRRPLLKAFVAAAQVAVVVLAGAAETELVVQHDSSHSPAGSGLPAAPISAAWQFFDKARCSGSTPVQELQKMAVP